MKVDLNINSKDYFEKLFFEYRKFFILSFFKNLWGSNLKSQIF